MSNHEVGVECPLCKKGQIVAEVNSVTNTPTMLMPLGPASRDHYREVVTGFHCSACQVMFYQPPGKPNAATEILKKIR